MTSAALILAMLPLAVKIGNGGEWRAPLATTVIGGLLTSTLLTLLVIPSVYTMVDDAQLHLTRLPRRVRRLAGRVKLPLVAPRPMRMPVAVARRIGRLRSVS